MPFPLVVQLLVSGVCYLLDPEGGLDSLKKKKQQQQQKEKEGTVSYHAQISLKVKENLVLPDIPQLGHIVGK